MKKFTDSNLWEEDWFLSLPLKYLLLFIYIKDTCDFCGIWKTNKIKIEFLMKEKAGSINLEEAYALYNSDKQRFIEVAPNKWLLLDYFSFQYGNKINIKNPVHRAIVKEYEKLNIDLSLIRGLGEDSETSPGGLGEDSERTKDKEKDKDNNYNKIKDKEKEYKEKEKKLTSFRKLVFEYQNKYDEQMLEEFISYWTQMNPGGKRFFFEMKEVFDIGRRLATWFKNEKKFYKPITKINLNEISH